jgi:DNA (cytosine-5)-methyltransferase 1
LINENLDKMQDERGQIIYGLTKIMRSKNLKYFILENVKGLTNHEKGNSLKIILNELDRVGYKVFHKVLNSIDYGVPQMRERIYLVGIRKDLVPKNFEFNFPEPQSKVDVKHYLIDPRESEFKENKVVYATFLRYLKNKYNNNQYSVKNFLKQEYVILDTRQSDLRIYHNRVPTLRTGRHGILYVRDGKFRKLSGVESLLLQGFPKDLIKRVDGYINENYLLKQAGNAMTVNTIEAISRELFKTLKKYEQ